ncbi:MAG TPA: SDR family oxidoreductase [Candidatus Limnocylindrales bacterium]|nr:SDR family oxidoreductase [Candidatus Limnocylindrales bacterium]
MTGPTAERRRILIAGASAGIGAALVRALAADGHEVFACARRAHQLRAVTGGDTIARSQVCDVGDEEQVRALYAWVSARTPALDGLIVAAGAFGAIGPFEQTESAAWWGTLRANVFGLYALAKHGLPLLERGSRPRIITFSGGGAFGTFPRYSAYATSKAAVVRLTECLADELRPRAIAVNAVAPGMVATEIHKATVEAGPGRAGVEHFERTQAALSEGSVPMEVPVDCVRFLLSHEADGLTGKTIAANFDPWRGAEFRAHVAEIAASDVYTLRRINPVHLPDGPLKERLS